MQTILLVFHLILAITLVGLVLMQQSEGGALGIGGGTPFMGARATANALTRTTAVLAALFMLTSVGLTVVARESEAPRSILDQHQPRAPAPPVAPQAPAPTPPAIQSPAIQSPAIQPPQAPAGPSPGAPVAP